MSANIHYIRDGESITVKMMEYYIRINNEECDWLDYRK